MDPSDGIPRRHHQHPDGKNDPEALPVGPRICSGPTLRVQVGTFDLYLIYEPIREMYSGVIYNTSPTKAQNTRAKTGPALKKLKRWL